MNSPPSYPSYEERTFNLYQIKDNPGIEYLRHPSGVIIIRLSADHECLTKEIEEISFETSNRKGNSKDLSKQVVVGKGKKGGLKLMADTKLCIIKCKDNSYYTIRSGIKAALIEANSRLIEDPQLLKTSRVYAGFIAIVIPSATLNSHKNTIPSEFDTIVRVGREIAFTTKIFAPNSQSNVNCEMNTKQELKAGEQEFKDAEGDLEYQDVKRQKIED